MARTSRAAVRGALVIGFGVVWLCGPWAAQRALASKPMEDVTLAAQLGAGEFTAALETAQQLPPGPARDAQLQAVAAAQYRAGAREASLSTLGQMDDDRDRYTALKTLETSPPAARGASGGGEADFDSLIDLITSTVSPASWDQTGGPGSIAPFPSGVYVDAEGVMRPLLAEDSSGELASLRIEAAAPLSGRNAREHSTLRKISLTRLEKQVQLLAAAGRPPTEAMRLLAGLERIKYVLVYPETHDIVLAGPAGDWQRGPEGRFVSVTSGHPVVQLDDLVVVLRHMLASPDARFGCSITPTEEAPTRTKTFVAESNQSPLKPGQRDQWLKQLRKQLGLQKIDVNGIDPRTRVGRIMVEADYRMKLVGMGLEDGVLGVPSYLSMIRVPPGESAPPMDVLRWWFTLHYTALQATKDHDAFEIRGQGVRVLSENELLTATGQQVHTGQSNLLNEEFAHNFTQHFPELAIKYPVYAELQNIFDLALVGAVMRSENLPERIGWHMTCFGDPNQYRVELADAPKTVETVINHRIVNRSIILVGVSGGVSVDPAKFVAPEAIETDYGALREQRSAAGPEQKHLAPDAWWWD